VTGAAAHSVDYDLHRDPRSSHQRIARIVRRIGRDPVLDVGAASGQLGRLLLGSGLTIDGIEPDGAAAESAAPYYRSMQQATVEEADLPARTYRVIVCADVLEHTSDPAAVLHHLMNAATDDALVIVSVPNIGHLAARAIVAAGHFPQHERGIFDRTHLHFYTRRTALDLLRTSHLRVLRMFATPVPLEEIWPKRLPRAWLDAAMRLQALAARLAPTLFAFQWVIVAERS
jgi:2-polyprenyl-3-methyl-5-hydroxy-6-metoxy-1,4-benzoquinol methylase